MMIAATGEPGAASNNRSAKAAPTTTVTAAITAMPPPCGVGVRWDDRTFGLASA
jgi:hypothetical protein